MMKFEAYKKQCLPRFHNGNRGRYSVSPLCYNVTSRLVLILLIVSLVYSRQLRVTALYSS